jgi:hypothetical protein
VPIQANFPQVSVDPNDTFLSFFGVFVPNNYDTFIGGTFYLNDTVFHNDIAFTALTSDVNSNPLVNSKDAAQSIYKSDNQQAAYAISSSQTSTTSSTSQSQTQTTSSQNNLASYANSINNNPFVKLWISIFGSILGGIGYVGGAIVITVLLIRFPEERNRLWKKLTRVFQRREQEDKNNHQSHRVQNSSNENRAED